MENPTPALKQAHKRIAFFLFFFIVPHGTAPPIQKEQHFSSPQRLGEN